jgi:ligand-binding sensor domain-containing protein
LTPTKGVTARYWSGGKGGFYLPADNFQHFYQDAKGIYWLATANSGLIRWDRRKNRFVSSDVRKVYRTTIFMRFTPTGGAISG